MPNLALYRGKTVVHLFDSETGNVGPYPLPKSLGMAGRRFKAQSWRAWWLTRTGLPWE